MCYLLNLLGLVLNKCDLLQAKLQRGIRIRDSVPSYHNRANDLPTATRCESMLFLLLLTCYPYLQTLRLPTTLQRNRSPVFSFPQAFLCSSYLRHSLCSSLFGIALMFICTYSCRIRNQRQSHSVLVCP